MLTWIVVALALAGLMRLLFASRSSPAGHALPSGATPSGASHVELRIVELELDPGARAEALLALGAYGAAEREILSVPADGSAMLVFAMRRLSRLVRRAEGHVEVLQPPEARSRLDSLGHDLRERRVERAPSGYRDGLRALPSRPDDPLVLAIAVALATHPTIAARPFRGEIDEFVRDLVVGKDVLVRLAFHPDGSA